MAERVRVGLIGAGGMANRVHYPSLKEMPDVEPAALCDLVPEKLAATAAQFGIPKTYSDYREMLAAEDLDAVYVLMPPHQLFDVVIAAAKAGKHVFIEKPPGVTHEQARMMAHACAANGVIGMCGFNRRYIPLVRQCRDRIEANGGMIQCVATFYKHHVGGRPYYEGAVDILTCDAIHAVDMLRWMAGEPTHVASDVARRCNPFDDAFNALLRFESGATGVLLTNWCVGARTHTFEMHGRGISAFINPDDRALIYTRGNTEPVVITARDAAGSSELHHYYGFFGANRHFIDCVKERRQPSSSLEDAAKTMALVNRIYGSVIS